MPWVPLTHSRDVATSRRKPRSDANQFSCLIQLDLPACNLQPRYLTSKVVSFSFFVSDSVSPSIRLWVPVLCRDIDDFVDNFDFIMLIKCYGLKCSTFQSVRVGVGFRVGVPSQPAGAAGSMDPRWYGIWYGVWYSMVPCPLLSSAHHNSLVTISSDARRVGLPDFDNCLC